VRRLTVPFYAIRRFLCTRLHTVGCMDAERNAPAPCGE
jgi:hypothetical protein